MGGVIEVSSNTNYQIQEILGLYRVKIFDI